MPSPGRPTPQAADGRPDFLIRLGLLPPVSPEDVEQAYLEAAKRAHPDRGGSTQQFLELQSAYQRAKEYARFFASRRRWLAEAVERYAAQQELIAQIERRGGQVKTAHFDWLAREIGADFAQVLETIDGIALVGPDHDDRTIDFLVSQRTSLGELHLLDLSGSRVSNAGVARLTAFEYLRRLSLCRTPVGAAGLRACVALARLEWLAVTDSRAGRLARFLFRVARPDVELVSTRSTGSRGFRGRVPLLAAVCGLYWLAMSVATHVPLRGVKLPDVHALDKVFHVASYGGLALLLGVLAAAVGSGATPAGRPARWWRYALIVPVVALYGVVDELTQPPMGRSADWRDWVADFCGASIGLGLFLAMRFALKRFAQRRWARLTADRMTPIG